MNKLGAIGNFNLRRRLFSSSVRPSGTPGQVEMTVAYYLMKRIEQQNVTRLFGIPGNYTAPLLNTILEQEDKTPIKLVTMQNELICGYAADGYARVQGHKGFGVLHFTYGVGAFVGLNAVAGSYVENVPLLVINGAPTNKEFRTNTNVGLVYQHMLDSNLSNLNAFKSFTVYAEKVTNALEAPQQIDRAITASITHKLPSYLEIYEDVFRSTITVPEEFPPLPTKVQNNNFFIGAGKTNNPETFNQVNKATQEQTEKDHTDVQAAVAATINLIKKQNKPPVLWAGIELQRFGLQEEFKELLRLSGLYYYTNSFSKSLIPEDNHQYLGTRAITQDDDVFVIGLGVVTTGADTGNSNIRGEQEVVLIGQGSAFIGSQFYGNVPLDLFMKTLAPEIPKIKNQFLDMLGKLQYKIKHRVEQLKRIEDSLTRHEAEAPVDWTSFMRILNQKWVSNNDKVVCVVDVSFSLVAAQDTLSIKVQNGFVSQANWLGIGYSSPAAVGVKFAFQDKPELGGDKRVIVITGDGAFQEAGQALASMAQEKQNSVVFVMNNKNYGVEQQGVNPNPFRQTQKINYSEKFPGQIEAKLLDSLYDYNILYDWRYEKLVDVYNGGSENPAGKGLVVRTNQELIDAIKEIKDNPNTFYVVNVHMPLDQSATPVNKLLGPGEDEILHVDYPPKTF